MEKISIKKVHKTREEQKILIKMQGYMKKTYLCGKIRNKGRDIVYDKENFNDSILRFGAKRLFIFPKTSQ